MSSSAEAAVSVTSDSILHFDTPAISEVEEKVRAVLVDLARQQRVLGIQVCVYKDGKVVVDTAAGVLSKSDPRPVRRDSLFPVFSTTKGVVAGLVHWLVDHGALNFDDKVVDLWPEFGVNGKEKITVAHVLNHTAGLWTALAEDMREDPFLMSDFQECVRRTAAAKPLIPPGRAQVYHAMSFGWLCGGIIERVSKKSFQDFLAETFTKPLGISGEAYVGIPHGVESRLASISIVNEGLKAVMRNPDVAGPVGDIVAATETLFNDLRIRRGIVPAANGHFSARALARYYAMLAAGGKIPESSSTSEPPLDSHPQLPSAADESNSPLPANGDKNHDDKSLFTSPKFLQAMIGRGEYSRYVLPGGVFGLGLYTLPWDESQTDAKVLPFGHSGLGGSTAICDPVHNYSIAVTLNELDVGEVASEIIRTICAGLGVPHPRLFKPGAVPGVDMTLDLKRQMALNSEE